MTDKLRNTLAIVFMAIPSFMLVMSAAFKLSGAQMVVDGMTKIGYGSYILYLGAAELVFVALLWIPKTWKVGFFFLLSYLGGAAAIEISGEQIPNAIGLILCLWIGGFLKDGNLFSGSKQV